MPLTIEWVSWEQRSELRQSKGATDAVKNRYSSLHWLQSLMSQAPVSSAPRVYPIFTVRWLALHTLGVPTVFFLGALAAMQFIRRWSIGIMVSIALISSQAFPVIVGILLMSLFALKTRKLFTAKWSRARYIIINTWDKDFSLLNCCYVIDSCSIRTFIKIFNMAF